MPRYKSNGKTYNLPDDKVEEFLKANPDAVLLQEENFQNGDAETDASVSPVINEASNMESPSDPGSSDLPQIPTQIGDELQGVSIDDIPRETPTGGQLEFGDQRDLEAQVADFKKDYVDAFNGDGRFAEILEGKEGKERLDLMEKLLPRPKYVQPKYNKLTGSYKEEPTSEAVELFSSYLPSDFDLFDKPEQFKAAMEDAKAQAISDDPSVKLMLGARMSVVSKEAEQYKLDLAKKHDLSTPDGMINANKDYQDWFNINVVDYIEDSTALEEISDQLEEVGGVAMSERNTEFGRDKDFMLSAFDFDEDSVILDFGEAMYKGARQMGVGYRKSVTSQFHGQIIKYDNKLQGYKKRLDEGKISQEKFDGLTKYYQARKEKAQKSIVKNVEAISETEGYLSLFEKSNLKDGAQFDDVIKILGEAIPQIAAAGAGAVTGNPALASMGLISIFGQEYGNNYYEAIIQGLLAEDKEPSKENIALAISDGKYANRAEAAAFAGMQTALERVGATGVMKSFSKSIGFSNIKKMASSIYKNGIKDFVKKSLPKSQRFIKGAGGEYLTEGSQTGLSQISVGSQLELETDLDLGYTKFLDGEEILESAEAGGYVGFFLPFGGAVINQTTLELRNAARDVATKFDLKGSMLNQVNGFFKAAEENLRVKFYDKGELTQEQYKEELQNLSNSRNTGLKIPKNYSDKSKQTAFDLILKRDKITNKIAGLDDSLTNPEKQEVKDINLQLAAISVVEGARIKKGEDTSTVEDVGKQLGFGLKKLTAKQLKAKGYNAKEDLGFIEGNTIFLNEKLIGKTLNVKTASHELLHGILYNSIKNGKLTRPIIETWYKNNLSAEQIKVLDERIEKGGYKTLKTKDGKNYLDVRPDEYLTQIYEAGLIDQPGMFEKVKLLVQDIINTLGSPFGLKTNFAKKDDLKEFLRAYDKTIKTGKLSQKVKDMVGGEIDIKAPTASSKATSEAASNKVQQIFETKGKNGAIEIIEQFKPITNRIVQSRSQAPGFDRQLLTDEIETGKRGILDLISEYDASKGVPLAAYINQFLPSRAIEASKRVLGEEFTVDVTEAKGVTDTTTEETTEQVAEKPVKAKESLRKKIKITDATSKKVVDAVVKTFGTKLPPADSKKFKQALQKAFRTELKTTIAKDVLGSRAAYEAFLRDNFENIYEAIPQDVINKRFRQFAEDTGKREKTKEGKKIFKKKDITKAEFIKYFLGRDVGTSTKGTRKDALAEALAQEFATDATMQTIQKPNIVEKRKFVDKEQTTEKVSKAIDRPSDFAFSKIAEDAIDNIDFVVEAAQGRVKVDGLLKFYKLQETLVIKNEKDIDTYINKMIEDVFPLLPRQAFFGPSGGTAFTSSSKIFGLTSLKGKDGKSLKDKNGKSIPDPLWTKIVKRFKNLNEPKIDGKNNPDYVSDSAFGKPILDNRGNPINLKISSYATLFKNPATIEKNIKNGDIDRFNTKVGLIHETLWKRINESISKNKNAATGIATYLRITANDTKHWHKQGAAFVGYSTKPIGKVNAKGKTTLYEYEHAMPATAAYLYLLDVALSKSNFKPAYNAVMDNYKLIALDKADNAKLAKAKLGIGMPKGWKLGENAWWQRYFNNEVAKFNGGINPNSLTFTNGRTFADQLQIDSSGNFSTVAFSKSRKQAKAYNEKILPPVIDKKFDKNATNNQVLDEMEKLDKESIDARTAFSKTQDLNKDFNDIIERATGIGTKKQYGQTKARAVGADKGRWDWAGIPPSAQDFVGLTRYFAGKGKEGDKTIAWVKENFLDPFARANIDISNARVALANDFKGLKKLLKISPKDLNKKIPGEPYTIGNAIRVYTWGQQGMKVPGLSKADQKILEDLVAADKNLQLFANELIAINKDNGYPKPQDSWLAGTITTDLLSGLNTVVRAKYLKQWQNNVNEVFTEANMNKLEAAYGKGYRDALENMLGRMKTGSNRGFKGDTLTGRFVDWLNGSIGAIMFFNMRSAVLQTISAVNFVNWSDNNPLKAAAAFGDQPQYWGDVVMLMNSDYLVERRNGLKININEADIAEIAAESKNKAKAFISKLLKLGFLPTQIADSFAIASGGATFYRNRYKSLKKEGLSDTEAKAQAFQDFREVAEESQQSSRPDRISAQQAGPMGRVILAFANTPAQYARLMQKAASDLKNRRGDDKTNISKIIYYGAIQNVIFNALQQALFAMAFGDEEADEEKKNKKYTGIVNGMSDSLLRGVGFHGAAISTLKNVVIKLAEGAKAQDAAIEMLDISPPISSKIGKLKSAGRTWDWNKKEIMEKGWSLDNPAYLAAGQVVSAATNVPLDRGIRKLQNLKDASDAENEEWMRVANALGWAKWELEWEKDKPKKKKKKRTFGKTLGKTFGKKLKL